MPRSASGRRGRAQITTRHSSAPSVGDDCTHPGTTTAPASNAGHPYPIDTGASYANRRARRDGVSRSGTAPSASAADGDVHRHPLRIGGVLGQTPPTFVADSRKADVEHSRRITVAATVLPVWLLATSAAAAPADDTTAAPEPPDASEPAPPPADASASEAEVEALRERLQALEAQVEALQQSRAGTPDETPSAEPKPEPKPKPKPKTKGHESEEAKQAGAGDVSFNREPDYAEGFHFGSYGRVMSGARQPGPRRPRARDIVAYGSRLDESTLRRARAAARGLLGGDRRLHPHRRRRSRSAIRCSTTTRSSTPSWRCATSTSRRRASASRSLKVWAGSRMYRGDDIYLLNFWPLDNLNTLGGGAQLRVPPEPGAQAALRGQPAAEPVLLPGRARGPGRWGRSAARRCASPIARSRSRAPSSATSSRSARPAGSSRCSTARSTTPRRAQRERETQQYENLPRDRAS